MPVGLRRLRPRMSSHSSTHSSEAVPYHVEPYPVPHGFANRPPRDVRNAAMLGHDNYYEAEKYAKNVAYLSVAIVALGILPGLIRRLRCRYPKRAARLLHRIPGLWVSVALARRVTYYQPRLFSSSSSSSWGHFPSMGPFLLNWAFNISIFVYCMAVKPWYRFSREWGSPPLAIRAGMLANGLFPILFATSTKVNVITILTTLSHERLQLYHQWIGRLMLLLSIMHTVPFFWQPLREGGFANFKSYWDSDPVYWNGSVALGILVWLVVTSTQYVRRLHYEFFVINHIFSILAFLGFYFFHTNDYLNSWRYLWAAVFLWAAAVVIRWLQSSLASRYFIRMKASVEVIIAPTAPRDEESKEEKDDDSTCVVRVAMHSPIKWKAGQHVFLRFPTLAPFQSHPFTIVTLPQPGANRESQIVCVARVHRGNTKTLRDAIVKSTGDVESSNSGSRSVQDSTSLLGNFGGENQDERKHVVELQARLLPAVIDGPYGADGSVVGSYDSVVLIAGGLGITFALPVMMSICQRESAATMTKAVRLVWSIRSLDLLQWFSPFLEAVFEELSSSDIEISMQIHVTGSRGIAGAVLSYATLHSGRPDPSKHVSDAFKQAETARATSLAVVTCGPREMMRQAANASAALQASIIKRGVSSVREVYLMHESFGW